MYFNRPRHWLIMFKSPPGSTMESETSESVTVDSDMEVDLSPRYPSFDSMFIQYQPYLDHVSAYQPIYFLVGTDPGESKFQFSFKYRLVDPESSLAERYRFMDGLVCLLYVKWTTQHCARRLSLESPRLSSQHLRQFESFFQTQSD